MAKVFRLFNDVNIEHWGNRNAPYQAQHIEKIANPDGDFSKKEPTSIPSPFARIDLVRTAFKAIKEKNQLDGNTIYHKLVSDCFDVGEIFFKRDFLADKIQIKSWDKNIDLNTLKNSNNSKHRLYGETLELYLMQDSATYNFDILNKVYLILYDYKIIGGTSPSTCFFTSANDLSFTNIQFGNDILFDSGYKPLYERDPDYQKYLYCFFKENPQLVSRMREFSEYLDENLKFLQHHNINLYREICLIKNDDNELDRQLATYEPLDTGIAGDNLEIIGCWMKKKKTQNSVKLIEESSDFIIVSSKYTKERKPLVLQNNFSQPLIYTHSSVLWDSNTEVPFFDEKNLNDRTLPRQLDKYPYLTVSDFLQPYIMRLPYTINKEKYFDGNITFQTGDKEKNFMLPLTALFFEFFDTEDLKNKMTDGKPMFEMVSYLNSVEVTLRVPIRYKNRYITFKRTYENKNNIVLPNIASDLMINKGYIIDTKMSLLVYPFLKTETDDNAFYRIMSLDGDVDENQHYKYDLSFYKNNDSNPLIKEDTKRRSDKKRDDIRFTTDFFLLDKEFDYVIISHNDTQGVIIPQFQTIINGSDVFTFAIDFGTTNTHIEYKTQRNPTPQPFEITNNDLQFATLFTPLKTSDANFNFNVRKMDDLITHEFIPQLIGRNQEHSFPTRTVLGASHKLDTTKKMYALADFNIALAYQKSSVKSNTDVFTDLKWANTNDARLKIEKFFEKLIFLIRTKVLLNNGDLSKTQLIWFYPSSMTMRKRSDMERIWRDLFHKYITTQHNPIKLSESVAPFYYFKKNMGVSSSDLPVVSIDIGGGTTDVVIYENDIPKLLTSFKFAANAIFGDAYNSSSQRNGFVQKYQDVFSNVFSNIIELHDAYKQIGKKENSADIIAFFFSLEHNKKITEKKLPKVSFHQQLVDDEDMKIVFIIFYSSIIYHIAKLMKAKGLKAPKYVTFSGTGSKMISILDISSEFDMLNKLTRAIFEKVYEVELYSIKIKQYLEPKEITCKGGLLSDTNVDIEEIKSVFVGTKEDTIITEQNNISYSYDNITEDKLISVIEEVNLFVDLIYELHSKLNFNKNFGVTNVVMNEFKEIIKENLMQHLKTGLDHKKKELEGDTAINLEESLFFYPLIGSINDLAFEIYKKHSKLEVN